MKRSIIILVCLMATAFFATAQETATNKGNWQVSPSSAFQFSFGEGGTNSLALGVSGHHFVVDDLGVGAKFSFDWNNYFNSSWGFVFGPSVRYYVLSKVRVGAGLDIYAFKNSDLQLALPLEVGYPIFVTPNVAIEPNLNFTLGLSGARGFNSVFGLNFDFFFGDN